MKILGISLSNRKAPVQKVFISPNISEYEYLELAQNRGIMDEFMRKKDFKIDIKKAFFCDSEKYLNVFTNSSKMAAVYAISKEGDESLITRMIKLLQKISEDYAK